MRPLGLLWRLEGPRICEKRWIRVTRLQWRKLFSLQGRDSSRRLPTFQGAGIISTKVGKQIAPFLLLTKSRRGLILGS